MLGRSEPSSTSSALSSQSQTDGRQREPVGATWHAEAGAVAHPTAGRAGRTDVSRCCERKAQGTPGSGGSLCLYRGCPRTGACAVPCRYPCWPPPLLRLQVSASLQGAASTVGHVMECLPWASACQVHMAPDSPAGMLGAATVLGANSGKFLTHSFDLRGVKLTPA